MRFSTLCCLIIQFLLAEAKSLNSNSCYNSTRNFYPYLTSRTPYQSVPGDIERPDGCTPLQTWMTARHDIPYPDTMTKQQMLDLNNFRDQILTNHEGGRGQICFEDLTNLRLWQNDPNFYETETDTLDGEGEKALHLLAKRLKNVFPEVLQSNDSNDPKSYNFMVTNEEQITSSLISFANGLLNTSTTVDYEDNELKESKDCNEGQKMYLDKEQITEFRKFKDGPHVQQALLEISQRLGFLKTVPFDTVNTMYEACRHETALNPGNISVWCTVFSEEDVKVFEYLSDLNYYYCCGPGNRLSRKLSCGILKKLFKTFSQLVTANDNQPNGLFHFDHSTNVQSVMTLLKVYQPDEPLLASNYESLKDRLFNATFMNPYSSNVVAVLYRCDNTTIRNQVQLHVADNPVEIPGCDGQLCDWEYLKREFKPVLDECDTNFCDFSQDIADTISSASSTCEDSYLRYLILMIFITFNYYLRI